MTTATHRNKKQAPVEKPIRDVELGMSYGFPYLIQFDPNDQTFLMNVDGQPAGFAHSIDAAHCSISELCSELALHTHITTADIEAEKLKEELDTACAEHQQAPWDAGRERRIMELATAINVCSPTPPRTVDELRKELEAVNDAIIGTARNTDAWDRLDAMRAKIIIDLNEAHKSRVGVCHCGSRAVAPTAHLCPYHAAIEQAVRGPDDQQQQANEPQTDPLCDQCHIRPSVWSHAGRKLCGDCITRPCPNCGGTNIDWSYRPPRCLFCDPVVDIDKLRRTPSVDYAALGEDPTPENVTQPAPITCSNCKGPHHIQRCPRLLSYLVLEDDVIEIASPGNAACDGFFITCDFLTVEMDRLPPLVDPCAGLRRELEQVKGERDGFRAALEQIADMQLTPDMALDNQMQAIARAALGKDTSRE